MFSLVEKADGGGVLILPADLTRAGGIGDLWLKFGPVLEKTSLASLELDFSGVSTVDTAGAAFVAAVERRCEKRGIALRRQSVAPAIECFLDQARRPPVLGPESAGSSGFAPITHIGERALVHLADLRVMISFIGGFFIGVGGLIKRPGRFRVWETLHYVQFTGASAMPIVFLVSFLMGLVMAFQGAVQLRQFGANIYVADLLSLAMTREIGPVLTAFVLAGRSGSAFAAEIGTMTVNEEVDALRVMGLDIIEFLVIPKVIALALAGPLLTMLANASGITGGIVVGMTVLDLSPGTFLDEAMQVLRPRDVAGGIVKSFAFAIFIGLVGCLRGLQCKRAAESVGRQTTSAVVTGIFLVILLDAVFTIIYHVFKI